MAYVPTPVYGVYQNSRILSVRRGLMLVAPKQWIGVLPDRMSFGWTGYLYQIYIADETVKLWIQDLICTPDTFDKALLGLSGHSSITTLFDIAQEHKAVGFLGQYGGRWGSVYIGALSRQGRFRHYYSEGAPHHQIGTEFKYHALPEIERSLAGDKCLNMDSFQGKVVINRLELTLLADHWKPFFLHGDEQWHREVGCLAENLKGWTSKSTILKKTLCPPSP